MVAASFAVVAAVVAVPSVSHASGPTYYVSLGDSYSVGYQPGLGATSGYTGAVVAADPALTLENFGCGGATTDSLLTFNGVCGVDAYGPPAATNVGPSTPGQTQIQAADAFIAAHPGQIGLVTVSIGGNDVTACASAPDPVSCVGSVVAPIKANVTTLAVDLRAALGTAGKHVPIVGLTYPDVLLGDWVNAGGTPTFPPSTASQSLASESVLAFKLLINPTLKAAYKTGKGKFVDVTKKTGAYTNFKKKTPITLAPFGTITVPKAVAQVCNLTWYCQLGNIHANTQGYALIGQLVEKAGKLP
jgi:lysophospholipase L1-like esterase